MECSSRMMICRMNSPTMGMASDMREAVDDKYQGELED